MNLKLLPILLLMLIPIGAVHPDHSSPASSVLLPNSVLVIDVPHAMDVYVDAILHTTFGTFHMASKVYVQKHIELSIADLFPYMAENILFATVLGVLPTSASRYIKEDYHIFTDVKLSSLKGFVKDDVTLEFLSKLPAGEASVGKLSLSLSKSDGAISSAVYKTLYGLKVNIKATGVLTEELFLVDELNFRTAYVDTKEGLLTVGIAYTYYNGLYGRPIKRQGDTAEVTVELGYDCSPYIIGNIVREKVYLHDVSVGDKVTINVTVTITITSSRPHKPLHDAYLKRVYPIEATKDIALVGYTYGLATQIKSVNIEGPGVHTFVDSFVGSILIEVYYGHAKISLIGLRDGKLINYAYFVDLEAYAFHLRGPVDVLEYSLPSTPRIR